MLIAEEVEEDKSPATHGHRTDLNLVIGPMVIHGSPHRMRQIWVYGRNAREPELGRRNL